MNRPVVLIDESSTHGCFLVDASGNDICSFENGQASFAPLFAAAPELLATLIAAPAPPEDDGTDPLAQFEKWMVGYVMWRILHATPAIAKATSDD